MMGFTADGQADAAMVAARDQRFGVDSARKEQEPRRHRRAAHRARSRRLAEGPGRAARRSDGGAARAPAGCRRRQRTLIRSIAVGRRAGRAGNRHARAPRAARTPPRGIVRRAALRAPLALASIMQTPALFLPSRDVSGHGRPAPPVPSPVPRIGVLTFHRCINYGSLLAGPLPGRGASRHGHRAVLLDHRSRAGRTLRSGAARCSRRNPASTPPADRRIYGRKTGVSSMPSIRCRVAAFALDNPRDMPALRRGRDRQRRGLELRAPLVRATTRSSSAKASRRAPGRLCGQLRQPPGAPRRAAHRAAALRRFRCDLGARRQFARPDRAVTRRRAGAGARPLPAVPPPCGRIARRDDDPASPSRVYGHSFSAGSPSGARAWARRHGLRLVSIGYRNDWADAQWLDRRSHDFARFIALAAAVATNFFHGCVFALRNGKPFVCEQSPYRATRSTTCSSRSADGGTWSMRPRSRTESGCRCRGGRGPRG